jgi:CheY-like chemotaxis protein
MASDDVRSLPLPPVDGGDEREVVAAACSIGSDVLRASHCSVWQLRDDGALLIGQHPDRGTPVGTVVRLDALGDVGPSVRRGEVALVQRDDPDADPVEAEQLAARGLAAGLRVPFSVADGDHWFLACSWVTLPETPAGVLVGTAVDLARLLSMALRRNREQALRWQRALELNDDVAQTLAAALAALELGHEVDLEAHLRAALEGTRGVMEDLTAQAPAGWRGLRRGVDAPVRVTHGPIEPAQFGIPQLTGDGSASPRQHEAPVQPDDPVEAPRRVGEGPTLLVADDTEAVRTVVRLAMRRYAPHWEVLEAVDGVEAVALARTCVVDAILLDLAMPRRSGL